MIFRFDSPEWLWLLLLLPLLAFLHGKAGKAAALRFSAVAIVRQVSAYVRASAGRLSVGARLLTLALLILALARPQAGEEIARIDESGIDIMITVDLSGSMWAHDFEMDGEYLDRLTVVKKVLREFVERRAGDRMGLIAFAGEAYLASPLTLDHHWILRRVEDLQLGTVIDGTAIGTALATSVRRLRDRDSPSRIIVLLTDGANNRGQIEPLQAAEAAAAHGIRVYTVGVGREGIVPFPAQFDENRQPVRRPDGSIPFARVRSDIDLPTIEKIAEMTGGAYFHATDTEQLQRIYAEIDELERDEIALEVRRLYSDIFWIPLAAALGILALEVLLFNTRFRRLP